MLDTCLFSAFITLIAMLDVITIVNLAQTCSLVFYACESIRDPYL
jgi:hypothetical protein